MPYLSLLYPTSALYLCYIFSLVDAILTFYTMFLMEKKMKSHSSEYELNLIARRIMRDRISPFRFLVICAIAFSVITVCLYLYRYLFLVFYGFYTIILWLHISNLSELHTQWDNEPFWEHRRILQSLKKK